MNNYRERDRVCENHSQGKERARGHDDVGNKRVLPGGLVGQVGGEKLVDYIRVTLGWRRDNGSSCQDIRTVLYLIIDVHDLWVNSCCSWAECRRRPLPVAFGRVRP